MCMRACGVCVRCVRWGGCVDVCVRVCVRACVDACVCVCVEDRGSRSVNHTSFKMILVVAVRCKSFEQLQGCLKCQTMCAYRWTAIIDVNWVVAAPKRLGLDRILIRWDL